MEISGEESNDSDCVLRRARKAAINELEESCFSGYLEQDSAISGIVDDDNPVYVILTVFPIILDSLFLYIPMINEEAKCLMLDENLKKIALVFRSLMDLPYIIACILFIVLAISWWRAELRDDKKALVVYLGIFGIIGALPIPQIAMLVLLPRMKGSNFSDGMKIMNTLIVLQYALRVYPFYKMCKSQNKEKLDKSDISKSYWVSGAINFIMYITACHFFWFKPQDQYLCMGKPFCCLDFYKWLVSVHISPWTFTVIWRTVHYKLEDDKYYMENIYSLLPDKLTSDIKLHLFLPSLKKEPMDEELLKEICQHLEPMNFNGIDYIIRQGEPLDMMFFVTQGTVLTYTINSGGSSSTSRLEKGDYYGEMLLSWAVASTSFSNVPISPQTVKSQRKVEVFAITAAELQLVVSKFYSNNLPGSPDNTHMKIVVANS